MSLSQSPVRLGFSSAQTRECAHLLYTHRLNRVKDKTMHRTDLYCLLSQYAGASLPSPEHDAYGFEFSSLEMQSTRILLHRLRVKPEGYLLFSLGTSRETKRYRDDSWVDLVKNCRRIYPKVPILLAGHGERDEALARQIYRAIAPGDAVLSAIGKTSVREMAMLVRQCMAIVSPDSMALHLASAFQKPAIGIFGGKSLTPVMGSPRANDLSQALASEIPCFPCRRNACDHHSCMKDITVGEILRGLQPMIPKKYRKGT